MMQTCVNCNQRGQGQGTKLGQNPSHLVWLPETAEGHSQSSHWAVSDGDHDLAMLAYSIPGRNGRAGHESVARGCILNWLAVWPAAGG